MTPGRRLIQISVVSIKSQVFRKLLKTKQCNSCFCPMRRTTGQDLLPPTFSNGFPEMICQTPPWKLSGNTTLQWRPKADTPLWVTERVELIQLLSADVCANKWLAVPTAATWGSAHTLVLINASCSVVTTKKRLPDVTRFIISQIVRLVTDCLWSSWRKL